MDLKKNWTSLLGVLFLLVAFIYLLRISLNSEWFTPTVKVTIGLIFSGGLLLAGTQFILRKWQMTGQFIAGAGVAVSFTTFAFAGIYYDLWTAMTVFLAMIGLTLVTTGFSYQLNLRILMNTALIGGLAAPLFLRPETDQVFTLFLYLLVLNAAYFFVAVKKAWQELSVTVFAGSWLLYIVYFIHFDPEITTWWSLPMRYAVAAFAFYLIALAWSNWNLRKTFDGINLYLGLVNGALFTFWAILILNQAQELPVQGSSLVVLAVGLSYLLSALIMYLVGKRLQMTVTLYAGGGLLLSLIATSSFFAGSAYEYVLQVFLWVAISVILLALFRRTNYAPLLYISQAIWFFVLLYWFITTWGSNHGEWFGTYIPFLNNGALAWMVLAALGFTYAVMMKVNKHETAGFAHIFAIISHLVVGGLLTVQVENLFADGSVAESITLSVTWGVYALLLFVWGAVRQENLYKIFGSIVLILVAIKTIFFDLWGSDTYYKVIALVILALISFAISYVNNRWKEKADEPEKTEQ